MADSILLDFDSGVATITLNRPESLNSFNEEMHGRLAEAMRRVKDSDARALLLTGAGRGFCAGQDLNDRNVRPGDEPPDLGRSLELFYNPLIRSLRALELPVVCAVNGVAAGAGANIALACDIVLAGRSASFIQAFCKIGLLPDSGGTFVLPRLVGAARAVGLSMLGTKLTAEQAEAWGLIWKCVDDDKLMAEARKLASNLATQPTKGLAFIKRALQASVNNTFDQQLDLERDLQREAGQSADYREGVTAFMERREPKFRGR
ncbi:MAG: 2-(1,2-epoxy-1,2-dihydrophenyl)acetyl-CoA isomerase PaaG [Xanthobacteraceae bacterium]